MKWKHVKRGTVYTEIGRGRLQTQEGTFLGDDCPVMVYRGEDGRLWARSVEEFEDGRFEKAEASHEERAETLCAAIDYAIEQDLDGIDWLKAWRGGGKDEMDELERWRKRGGCK